MPSRTSFSSGGVTTRYVKYRRVQVDSKWGVRAIDNPPLLNGQCRPGKAEGKEIVLYPELKLREVYNKTATVERHL